ncbi:MULTISPECIES: T3SS effector HopA1 family protein [unclassified Nodularia (in: cyanobacteria)]|uniref:T3SS effector HopA1 family protein n=1 Tax=unclassified Nodularia (in: cyanobacteria) TaxID=2656917 RepID=UPI00187EF503|nr:MULTISPECIES: T3SS effector HopA1 family protein [unclassified Nodularia (in: cyanobacteria)]MBE9197509.1 hypothetical protein [Nodularia sp. LEGE 06071]MCC2694378.1 hypothetical protein [Nodularia sp. LEGE 04288]
MTQLLNDSVIEQSKLTDLRLLHTLQDIVDKVEIHSNFSIHHPDYQPFELPPEAVSRFQSIPEVIKQKYLSLQLRNFLYGIYYNHSLRASLSLDTNTKNFASNLENNSFLGVDLQFYERLHASNSGTGYFDPGWSVIKQEDDGTLAVTKADLRLHIEREKHLPESAQKSKVGDLVAIRMPKNLVQNGFYMAVGNMGLHYQNHANTHPVTVRIYFNLTAEGAVAVMASLTQQLNAQAIPFDFKVLYNPNDYQRHDSGVLYFDKNHYQTVRQVLQTVYQEQQIHFQPEIPLFTMQLASGLGLAEEPEHKFATQESFGMNRCQIITNGMLAAWYAGEKLPENRMKAIFEQFSLLNIDWQHPYLNANSENIYLPLNDTNN